MGATVAIAGASGYAGGELLRLVAAHPDLEIMAVTAQANALLKASAAEGENLWRMPLPPQYDRMLDTLAADMKNIGGRPGGSITAALFIQRFVNGYLKKAYGPTPGPWTSCLLFRMNRLKTSG